MKKRITVIVLGVITIAELLIRKDIDNSGILWLCYGVYKFITDND